MKRLLLALMIISPLSYADLEFKDLGSGWRAYGDGTLEVYSYNVSSNSVASYRNTVGNSNVAKNSLFVSDCD
jgi:hypothetical protein